MKSLINQMDPSKMPVNPGSTTLYFIIAALLALVAGYVSYMILIKNKTVSSGNWSLDAFKDMVAKEVAKVSKVTKVANVAKAVKMDSKAVKMDSKAAKMDSKKVRKEGFQGPSKGVSDIQCGQESSYAVNLSALFASKESTTEEGEADLDEFKQILSKLCCLKHDLMSTNQVVQSTLSLKFNTSHDRENPADTTGRCFTKSLPSRDLDIIFTTWRERGLALLDKLCTSYDLNDEEAKGAKNDLLSLWSDTYDVGRTVCAPDNKDTKNASPRDVRGVMPEKVQTLGTYTGYY